MSQVAVRRRIDKHVVPQKDILEHVAARGCQCRPEAYRRKGVWVYIHNPYTDVEVEYMTEEAECQ